MKEPVQVKSEDLIEISGIKCDNTNCDYRDDSALFEQYPDWINKPCPKCGENLLTQENYDACVTYINLLTSIANNPELMELANQMQADIPMTNDKANQIAQATVDMLEQDFKSRK